MTYKNFNHNFYHYYLRIFWTGKKLTMNFITHKKDKYGYEKLDPASENFKFLKAVFDTKTTACNNYTEFYSFEIYKIIEKIPNKTVNEKNNNLMLFHGTSEKGAISIFKDGFRNSEKGWFGKGVYMTDCSYTAFYYSTNIQGKTKNTNARSYYIFVNEVLESEKLQTFEFDPENKKDVSTQPKHQFEKHIYKSSPQPTEKDFIVDLEGRRYVNTPKRYLTDEYIAEASVTIPRYLVQLKRRN